jgi:hypothetical protein
VTNDINVLRNTVSLENPVSISSADRTAPEMTVSVHGTFALPLSDGSTCDKLMYYCPSLADTIVSPQHFTSSAIHDRRYNGYCLIDMPGCCRILVSHSHDNDTSFIVPQKINDLYFISGSSPGSSGPHVSHLATYPQLLSEICYQRLSHPSPTRLSVLAKHSIDLPSQLDCTFIKCLWHQCLMCINCTNCDSLGTPTTS